MTIALCEPQSVWISAGAAELGGELAIPPAAQGVIAFAHGSGSGRHSPRNRWVAERLQEAGLATLLLDLLTPDEEAADRDDGLLRFDVGLLAVRLQAAMDWLARHAGTRHLRCGLFGASTGAAAALVAAAERPGAVAAVVSRGGRVDLAGRLAEVRCPTLLLVGGADHGVLELNHAAAAQLRCRHRLVVVREAGHLFAEPGALERVAVMAREWFGTYVGMAPWTAG